MHDQIVSLSIFDQSDSKKNVQCARKGTFLPFLAHCNLICPNIFFNSRWSQMCVTALSEDGEWVSIRRLCTISYVLSPTTAITDVSYSILHTKRCNFKAQHLQKCRPTQFKKYNQNKQKNVLTPADHKVLSRKYGLFTGWKTRRVGPVDNRPSTD